MLAGYRIGLYEHSSVARDFLHDLFTSLGAEVVRLGRSDDFVPIDTEAVNIDDQVRAKEWCDENEENLLRNGYRADGIRVTAGESWGMPFGGIEGMETVEKY